MSAVSYHFHLINLNLNLLIQFSLNFRPWVVVNQSLFDLFSLLGLEFLVIKWFNLPFQYQHFILMVRFLFYCPYPKAFYAYLLFISVLSCEFVISFSTAFRLFLLISLFHSCEFFSCLWFFNRIWFNHHYFYLFQQSYDLQKISLIFGLLVQQIWIFPYQYGISFYFYCKFLQEYVINPLNVNIFCSQGFFVLFQFFLRFSNAFQQKLCIIVFLIDILSFFLNFEISFKQQVFLQNPKHLCSFFGIPSCLSFRLYGLIFSLYRDFSIIYLDLSILLF